MNKKLIIIGSGPAGYTSAIYASRAGLNPTLYTGVETGGQLMTTTDVDNYPGFENGITGPELMNNLSEQAMRMGANIQYGTVTNVDLSKKPYIITIDDEKEIIADAIIIATGAKPKWLGLESEQKLFGLGVSSCAVCDGFFYKGKDVAVVGGGDTACEEALYLSKICPTVHLIIRGDEMKASKIMQDSVLKTSNIIIHRNSVTKEILGDKDVSGVLINKEGNNIILDIKGFFVAIGHIPNSSLFNVDKDINGYIITNGKSSMTNLEGVFACGDVQDNTYRQAITSAGSGCIAALDAEKYLSISN